MKSLKYKVEGATTLLMHSDVTANPLHPLTKELKALTSKRKKTDEDYERIARAEFIAGLYYKEGIGFYMPDKNIWSCLWASSKMFKQGVSWKQAAIVENDCKFIFPHSSLTPDELYEIDNGKYRDIQTMSVNGSRVPRCRPAFNVWNFEFTIIIDEAKLNERDIDQIVENAGRYVGLGDWRPRYGKFNIEKIRA